MTKEELDEIKKEYLKLKRKYKKLNRLYEMKRVLETDPTIEKYLDLLLEIDHYDEYSSMYLSAKRYQNWTDDEILDKALSKVDIKENSNIFVSNGNYVYLDIETTIIKDFPTVKEALEFEKNNIVLYPKGDSKGLDFFETIRIKYFKLCILDGPENALKTILNENNDIKLSIKQLYLKKTTHG